MSKKLIALEVSFKNLGKSLENHEAFWAIH